MLEKSLKEEFVKVRIESKAEGLAEGELKALRDIVHRLLAMGMKESYVVKATGLSLEEIQRLMLD